MPDEGSLSIGTEHCVERIVIGTVECLQVLDSTSPSSVLQSTAKAGDLMLGLSSVASSDKVVNSRQQLVVQQQETDAAGSDSTTFVFAGPPRSTGSLLNVRYDHSLKHGNPIALLLMQPLVKKKKRNPATRKGPQFITLGIASFDADWLVQCPNYRFSGWLDVFAPAGEEKEKEKEKEKDKDKDKENTSSSTAGTNAGSTAINSGGSKDILPQSTAVRVVVADSNSLARAPSPTSPSAAAATAGVSSSGAPPDLTGSPDEQQSNTISTPPAAGPCIGRVRVSLQSVLPLADSGPGSASPRLAAAAGGPKTKPQIAVSPDSQRMLQEILEQNLPDPEWAASSTAHGAAALDDEFGGISLADRLRFVEEKMLDEDHEGMAGGGGDGGLYLEGGTVIVDEDESKGRGKQLRRWAGQHGRQWVGAPSKWATKLRNKRSQNRRDDDEHHQSHASGGVGGTDVLTSQDEGSEDSSTGLSARSALPPGSASPPSGRRRRVVMFDPVVIAGEAPRQTYGSAAATESSSDDGASADDDVEDDDSDGSTSLSKSPIPMAEENHNVVVVGDSDSDDAANDEGNDSDGGDGAKEDEDDGDDDHDHHDDDDNDDDDDDDGDDNDDDGDDDETDSAGERVSGHKGQRKAALSPTRRGAPSSKAASRSSSKQPKKNDRRQKSVATSPSKPPSDEAQHAGTQQQSSKRTDSGKGQQRDRGRGRRRAVDDTSTGRSKRDTGPSTTGDPSAAPSQRTKGGARTTQETGATNDRVGKSTAAAVKGSQTETGEESQGDELLTKPDDSPLCIALISGAQGAYSKRFLQFWAEVRAAETICDFQHVTDRFADVQTAMAATVQLYDEKAMKSPTTCPPVRVLVAGDDQHVHLVVRATVEIASKKPRGWDVLRFYLLPFGEQNAIARALARESNVYKNSFYSQDWLQAFCGPTAAGPGSVSSSAADLSRRMLHYVLGDSAPHAMAIREALMNFRTGDGTTGGEEGGDGGAGGSSGSNQRRASGNRAAGKSVAMQRGIPFLHSVRIGKTVALHTTKRSGRADADENYEPGSSLQLKYWSQAQKEGKEPEKKEIRGFVGLTIDGLAGSFRSASTKDRTPSDDVSAKQTLSLAVLREIGKKRAALARIKGKVLPGSSSSNNSSNNNSSNSTTSSNPTTSASNTAGDDFTSAASVASLNTSGDGAFRADSPVGGAPGPSSSSSSSSNQADAGGIIRRGDSPKDLGGVSLESSGGGVVGVGDLGLDGGAGASLPESAVQALVTKVVCSSEKRVFTVRVDNVPWSNVSFVSISPHWGTHVKEFVFQIPF